MPDYDENAIGNPEVDADLDTEKSAATTTAITTTRTPGAALRALLTHAFTTTSSQCSPTGTSFSNSSPATPLPGFSSQPNQHAYIASEILPRLFISDIFTALNAPTLLSFHITHIISVMEYAVAFPTLSKYRAASESRVFPGSPAEPDLCSHPPPEPLPLPPFKTLHVPLADFPAADILSYFATASDFITAALKDENARVLVCLPIFPFISLCRSRTPCFPPTFCPRSTATKASPAVRPLSPLISSPH